MPQPRPVRGQSTQCGCTRLEKKQAHSASSPPLLDELCRNFARESPRAIPDEKSKKLDRDAAVSFWPVSMRLTTVRTTFSTVLWGLRVQITRYSPQRSLVWHFKAIGFKNAAVPHSAVLA
jgi:hypothetical protein